MHLLHKFVCECVRACACVSARLISLKRARAFLPVSGARKVCRKSVDLLWPENELLPQEHRRNGSQALPLNVSLRGVRHRRRSRRCLSKAPVDAAAHLLRSFFLPPQSNPSTASLALHAYLSVAARGANNNWTETQ